MADDTFGCPGVRPAAGASIRRAGAADVEAVAALHAESWRATYRGLMPASFLDGPVVEERRRVWTARLSEPAEGQHVAVAEAGADVVGFVCLLADPDGVLLDNLHVRPDRKGEGLGRSLLRYAFDWTVRHRPGARLFLWVLAGNEPAMGFYERQGGVRGRLRRSSVAGFELDEVEYAWAPEALSARGR